MIVEQKYQIKLSEIGKENKITNKAVLSYLEDVGGIHSNIAGYGLLDIQKTQLTWILLEWKLKIIRRPSYAEKIKVVTWSKGAVRCYAFRDFEIYDEQGKIIALAASKWVLIDIEKGKITKVEQDLLAKYETEPTKTAFNEGDDFEKIQEPENYQKEITYEVRRADIDVNNHMHNLNYMELANEVLPEEIYRGKDFDNIRITYKKEIKLGDIVKCKYAYKDGRHIVVVKSIDDKILHAIIEMK